MEEEKFDSYFSCALSEPDINNFELYINYLHTFMSKIEMKHKHNCAI